jgi:hypothetical protein
MDYNLSAADQVWLENGVPHRVDGPAIIRENGDEEYYIHGLLHNENGPALCGTQLFERNDGMLYKRIHLEYNINGKLHRNDGGPSSEFIDGEGETQKWFEHGVPHRVNAPCVIRTHKNSPTCPECYHYRIHDVPRRTVVWSINAVEYVLEHRWIEYGNLHRLHGPAVEYFDGSNINKYYIRGQLLTKQTFYRKRSYIVLYMKKIQQARRQRTYQQLYQDTLICQDACFLIAGYVC